MNTAQQRCAFYAPTLDEDSGRVDCLFAAAAHEQVAVREAALSETELYNVLRAETMLVIALVDGRLLYGGDGRPADERGGVGNGSNDSGGNQPKGNCSGNRSGKSNGSSKGSMHHNNSSSARGGSSSDGSSHNCGSQYSSSLFAGHYVLLVGLDDASGGVLVKDPARAEEAIVASIDRLEHARHAAGTDEDLLLVSLCGEEAPCAPLEGGLSKIARVLASQKATSSPP